MYHPCSMPPHNALPLSPAPNPRCGTYHPILSSFRAFYLSTHPVPPFEPIISLTDHIPAICRYPFLINGLFPAPSRMNATPTLRILSWRIPSAQAFVSPCRLPSYDVTNVLSTTALMTSHTSTTCARSSIEAVVLHVWALSTSSAM